MWLLLLVLLHACSLGLASECIDNTLRCTHRRVPFPIRKDLPETIEALNKVCRDQNEYYDCLQNIPGDKIDGDVPSTADKLNRLDAEYMLSELCTEGLKTRNNYLKQAVCINKQKTDVCVSPEFLIILLANEKTPSRCSVQNKVTSCVSMMLAMNCGAEAGFLYRKLLHIANDGDVHCNAGEDLGEVFSLFKLSEENENKESDKFDRFGDVSNEESSEEIFFHRFGEMPENEDSESESNSESTANAVLYNEHVPEKPFEADNLTFQNDGWNGMEFHEDWVLKTVYGRSLPGNSNIELSQDFLNVGESGLGPKICSPFEIDNKKQTNVNEQCFDQMLENIVEKDHIHENKQDVYMKSDADGEMHELETALITEMYTNRSDRDDKSEFQSGSLSTDKTSTNLASLENAHIGFSELSTSETVDEQRPLKDNEPSFYEQSMGNDLRNENPYIPVDMLYPHGNPAQRINENEKSTGSEVEFPTIDKIGSMDSIGRNIYTITDVFDYSSNPGSSIAFEDTYLVDEESIASVGGEQDSDFEDITKSHSENDALEEPNAAQATLKEIFKRIGEIEVATPLLEQQQFGTNETIDDVENLPAEDVSELTQYSELPESNRNELQRDFQSAVEDSIEYADSLGSFSGESYEIENPDREMPESKQNGSQMVQNIYYSEAHGDHPIKDEERVSTRIEFRNMKDLDSGFQEEDQIQNFDDLEQTSNLKLKYAYFITDDMKAQELVENFEIKKDSMLDEIGSATTSMDESRSENSSFPDSDPIQDLNNYESSSESLADFEGQYVTLQEYNTPFAEKDAEREDDQSSKDLKYSNEDSYFSSTESENMEGSGFDEFPAAVTQNQHASEFYEYEKDTPNELKLIDMNEIEYSGASDDYFLQSGLDELKVTMGASESNENHGLEETETSTDQMIEILEDVEPDVVQNRIEFEYNQPIVIKMSDEDIRNYYELMPHEPQNHLLLLTDEERAKFDPSESEFVKEHSSKFQMQDFAESDVPEVDGENEQVIPESEKIYLGNTENERLRELNSYLESSIEDVPEEGHISGYESIKDSSRRSLELETPALTHLNPDLTFVKETSSPLQTNEAFETSTTHSPVLESLKEDYDVLDIFKMADLTMHDQYLASEDVTLHEEEYSAVQNTEMAYSNFDQSVQDPEKIIMNHLDSLLQNDAVDHSSEDSIIEDDSEDEMNKEKMGVENEKSAKQATDESILIDQMNEEQIECHTDECQQLLSNQFSDEAAEQDFDAFRIKTNKIKTVTPYLEDFLAERLRSNKVRSRDSTLALVNENDSQVSESDIEQRIPCLHFFSVKDDGKRFGCYVHNSEPTYVIY